MVVLEGVNVRRGCVDETLAYVFDFQFGIEALHLDDGLLGIADPLNQSLLSHEGQGLAGLW